MTTRTIFIALFTTTSLAPITSYPEVIKLFNDTYPGNTLAITEYLVANPQEVEKALDAFVSAHPTDTKVIITKNSWQTITASQYVEKNGWNILVVATSANSNQIKTLKNTLTYAPYLQSSVMSFFLTFVEYQMKEIKILYEPNSIS